MRKYLHYLFPLTSALIDDDIIIIVIINKSFFTVGTNNTLG